MITPEYSKNVAVVVAFTETKATAYNPELGYVEWNIVATKQIVYKEEVLVHGQFFVENEFGKGYIFVYPAFIEHFSTFTVDDKTYRFHIRYKRKVLRR